jgi:hypothetical protein
MKTRRIALLVFLVALVVGVAFLLIPNFESGVTADRFRRLRPGMSIERVRAIMGRRADASPIPGMYEWMEDEVEIRIFTDHHDQVATAFLRTHHDECDTVESLHRGFSLLEAIQSVVPW